MLRYYMYFLKDVLSNSVFGVLQQYSQNQAFKTNYLFVLLRSFLKVE